MLLRHVEALEIALGDAAALEEQVQTLLDEVADFLHGTFANSTLPSGKSSTDDLPWPESGQCVWQHVGRTDRVPEPATVQLSFLGKDRRMWCLLECADADSGVRYMARPALALSPTPDGPTYFHAMLRQPAFAVGFLQQAGILDEHGGSLSSSGPEQKEASGALKT